MIMSRWHRRRLERFAQLLDEADGGRRQHRRTPLDDELSDLVALRQRLAASRLAPEVDPEFRTSLRAMLLAVAEREGIGPAQPEPALPAPRRSGDARAGSGARAPRTRTAVVAGVAAGAVAFTGVSTASEHATPGDALYGVKRSTERAQLALASSDVGRGQLYLTFARTRLAEARTLASGLDRVLDDMDRDTQEGARLLTAAAADRRDRAPLDAIDAFAANQRTALAELASRATGADLTRLTASLELLESIRHHTAALRLSLQDCPDPPANGIDSLGAAPATPDRLAGRAAASPVRDPHGSSASACPTA